MPVEYLQIVSVPVSSQDRARNFTSERFAICAACGRPRLPAGLTV
jgi:hypothetical protein